jgi:arabinoxylan arabinofuranohydrolase
VQHQPPERIRRSLGPALLLAILAQSPRAFADYPIASHRYLADPGALVSNGRVYLYNSNDDDNAVDGGYQMKSIVCISSSDLKNWTDHGEVFRVPANAGWANDSWAPAAIERNGLVYLYFGNNANGVGVASSSSPSGGFSDAKGGALVDASTPGASGTDSWLFDPSVFIDDDGQAYLTFGGNGDANARIIRLNSDMVSVAGSASALSVPNFFEASWLFKRNGLYYFSYSTNPGAGLRIDYLTSTNPMSGFTYRGVAADQPPSNNNNNHHSIFQFNGGWYHAYHNRLVATQAGVPTTYRRNLGLERLDFNSDGSIQQVTYTTDGVPQLANLDPYVRVEAETINAQSGIETEPCSEGGMDVTDLQSGDWTKVRGVDFGASGAAAFSASVASVASGGSIELRLDSPGGPLIGACTVPDTGGAQSWALTTCPVSGATGIHDLYLQFIGDSPLLFNVDYWQFTPSGAGAGDTGGSGSGATAGDGDVGAAGASGIYGVAGFGDAVGSGDRASGGAAGAPNLSSAGSGAGSSTSDPPAVTSGAGVRKGGGCSCAVGARSKPPAAPIAAAAFLLATWIVRRSRCCPPQAKEPRA